MTQLGMTTFYCNLPFSCAQNHLTILKVKCGPKYKVMRIVSQTMTCYTLASILFYLLGTYLFLKFSKKNLLTKSTQLQTYNEIQPYSVCRLVYNF
jgi:hypothetical protein